jgi:hypothetical protein
MTLHKISIEVYRVVQRLFQYNLKIFVKQNNDSNKTCRYVHNI